MLNGWLQVAYERDSEELRDVCLAVAAQCLPNILVCTPSRMLQLACIVSAASAAVHPSHVRSVLIVGNAHTGMQPTRQAGCCVAQVSASFEELVQQQPSLALNFVREVAVRHGMPFVPEPRTPVQTSPPATASTDGAVPEVSSTPAAALASPVPSAAASAAASPNGKQADTLLPSRASSAASVPAQAAQHLDVPSSADRQDGVGQQGSSVSGSGLHAHAPAADVSKQDSKHDILVFADEL